MKVLNILPALFLAVFVSHTCYGQAEKEQPRYRKNAIYAEGSIFSPYHIWFAYTVNYERMLLQKKTIKVTARAGYGHWAAWSAGGNQFQTGLGVIWGKKNHHLEVQGGYHLVVDKHWYEDDVIIGVDGDEIVTPNTYYHWPYFQAGYRFQKPGGRFLLKVHSGSYGSANLAVGLVF